MSTFNQFPENLQYQLETLDEVGGPHSNVLGNVTTIAGNERLPAGASTITYDFAYEGGGPGKGGIGTISINGKKVASGKLDRTIPFIYGTETADVGMDLYSTVTPDYKKGDNEFTGKINKVVIAVK